MRKRQKVIFLIGTLSNGGAERVISNLSMNLPDYFDCEIILYGRDAKIEYDFKGKITYLDRAHPTNPFTKLLTLIKRVKGLKEIKKTINNVPIVSCLEYPNLLNILSGNNKNSIVSVRNFMSTKHAKGLKSFFWNITIKMLYKKARKVIVVSNQMQKDLINNYKLPKEKIKLIYNSYPIREIEELAGESLTEVENRIFNKPVIITAGRLNKQKGQSHLLNSFMRIKKNLPHAQLVLLGEGILEIKLKEQANQLKISDSVHFLGFQQNPFKYIAKSKVFIMTSYYEGFPNALAEAMVCKVPVISTDCPSGPREILAPRETSKTIEYNEIQERYGFLVPPFENDNNRNIEELIANLIIDLINNKEKNKLYSEKSYKRIHDFDINQIIYDWIDVIQPK